MGGRLTTISLIHNFLEFEPGAQFAGQFLLSTGRFNQLTTKFYNWPIIHQPSGMVKGGTKSDVGVSTAMNQHGLRNQVVPWREKGISASVAHSDKKPVRPPIINNIRPSFFNNILSTCLARVTQFFFRLGGVGKYIIRISAPNRIGYLLPTGSDICSQPDRISAPNRIGDWI